MTHADWLQRIADTSKKVVAKPFPAPLPDHRRLFDELAAEDRFSSDFDDFRDWVQQLRGSWLFRGHGVATWDLLPTLERDTTQIVQTKVGSIRLDSLVRLQPEQHERFLLRKFSPIIRQHLNSGPEDSGTVNRLGFMQHFGAKTRFLDWTRSPYIALYFALANEWAAPKSAIWAVNVDWIEETSSEVLRQHGIQLPSVFSERCEYLDSLLLGEDNPSVIVAAFDRGSTNQRIHAQQGLFLCNLSHKESFDIGLLRMIFEPDAPDKQVVSKLLVQREQRKSILAELERMKIDEARLFPGSNFAEPLNMELEKQIEQSKVAYRSSVKREIRSCYDEDRP